MTTAVVLGATGLVGKNLVALLANNSAISKVVAVTRRPIKYNHTNIINQVIDFEHLEHYSSVFSGDMLFSCLGTTVKQAGSYQAQRKVDVEYQYQVAKFAANNQVEHYLLVSSSGANAASKSPYFQMKGELEQQIKSLPFKRISIFQPSLLLGERDHFRLGETLGAWLLPTLCKLPGLTKYRPITGKQVAQRMIYESLKAQQDKLTSFQLDEMFDFPIK